MHEEEERVHSPAPKDEDYQAGSLRPRHLQEFIGQEKLKKNLPSIPSTVKEELDCNIFLRTKNLEGFSKLRDLKDNF